MIKATYENTSRGPGLRATPVAEVQLTSQTVKIIEAGNRAGARRSASSRAVPASVPTRCPHD